MTHMSHPHVQPSLPLQSALGKAAICLKAALGRVGLLVRGCGHGLVAMLRAVARSVEMAYIDPYAQPRQHHDTCGRAPK